MSEANDPLTPIQALNRCREWFELHQPTAVLPGTSGTVVSELKNVIVWQELRDEAQAENAKLRAVTEYVESSDDEETETTRT